MIPNNKHITNSKNASKYAPETSTTLMEIYNSVQANEVTAAGKE